MNSVSLPMDQHLFSAWGPSSATSPTKTIKSKKVVAKKAAKAGSKKPLNAYNLYFKIERERMLNGTDTLGLPVTVKDLIRIREEHKSRPKRRHRKTHGKIAFKELNQIISKRWKQVPESERKIFHEHAMIEKEDHARKMAESEQQEQEHAEESIVRNIVLDSFHGLDNDVAHNASSDFDDLSPVPYYPEPTPANMPSCAGHFTSHPIEPLFDALEPIPHNVVSDDGSDSYSPKDEEQYSWREAVSKIEFHFDRNNGGNDDPAWNLPTINFDGQTSSMEKDQVLFQPLDPRMMESIFE